VYRPVYKVFYTVTDDFVSDHWTPEFEEGVVLPLVSLGQWRLATTREQLRQRKDSFDKLSIPGDRDGSPLSPITATSASDSSTKLRHSTVAGKVDTALQPSIPPAGPTRDTPKFQRTPNPAITPYQDYRSLGSQDSSSIYGATIQAHATIFQYRCCCTRFERDKPCGIWLL
jgi:hypothetical protein